MVVKQGKIARYSFQILYIFTKNVNPLTFRYNLKNESFHLLYPLFSPYFYRKIIFTEYVFHCLLFFAIAVGDFPDLAKNRENVMNSC